MARGFDIPLEYRESAEEAEGDRLRKQEEDYCIQQIERLKQEFVKACEPYVKRLTSIRRPPSITITIEDARRAGLL